MSQTQPKAKPYSRFASGQCLFIQTKSTTQTTTAIWIISQAVETVTTVLLTVFLSELLVCSITGLHRWEHRSDASDDRSHVECYITVIAVCIFTTQVILCLPMSVAWLLDVYYLHSFIHQDIYIEPLQESYSEALITL